eukprot:349738-Chlamydomonas_euryale.AAC.3
MIMQVKRAPPSQVGVDAIIPEQRSIPKGLGMLAAAWRAAYVSACPPFITGAQAPCKKHPSIHPSIYPSIDPVLTHKVCSPTNFML